MSYEYEFFLSYSRKNPVGNWVRNNFHPELEQWLASFAGNAPRIFIDKDIEEGDHWPSRLENALRRSKYLVAVWSPQYFTSPWCVAEWQSMRQREALLGLGTPEAPHGLVCAVVFSDGKTFPPEAQATQRHDLSAWNLEVHGLTTFFDERVTSAGTARAGIVSAALSQSRHMLALIGKSMSRWQVENIRLFLKLGLDEGRRAIPLLLPDTDPAAVPRFLRQFKEIDGRHIGSGEVSDQVVRLVAAESA